MEGLRSRLPSVRPAVVALVAVLGSWLTGSLIEGAAGLHTDIVVLAVVMALTLGRTALRTGEGGFRARRLLLLPVVALLAGRVGNLMVHHPDLGDALFVAALAIPVWLRRFGPTVTRLAGLAALPFLSLLVAPVAVSDQTAASLWPAAVAVLALAWVELTRAVAVRTGFLTSSEFAGPLPPPAAESLAAPTGASVDPRPQRRRRLRASTRMAVQLAVGLSLAFALGRWLYPQHWPWLVLTCYIVFSGNRGRGDVLHKGLLRLVGAAAGTVAATLLAGLFPAGDRVALVWLTVVLALAVWLRQASYAFWAAGVTAMLSLLYGYFGEAGPGLLVDRLGGVLLGAVIAVGVSWFVVPIRSGDVLRRRVATALAALSGYLTALRTDPASIGVRRRDYDRALADLDQITPLWRLHGSTVGRSHHRSGSHPAPVIALLSETRGPLAVLAELPEAQRSEGPGRRRLGTLAQRVAGIRRGLAAAAGPPVEPPSAVLLAAGTPGSAGVEPALARLDGLVGELERAVTREFWVRHGA